MIPRLLSLPLLLTPLSTAQEIAVSGNGTQPAATDTRTDFLIRQVAAGVVYLNGGSRSGLAEGMRLQVKRIVPGGAILSAELLGQIKVVAVAENSSLCEIEPGASPMAAGDIAQLSAEDVQMRQLLRGMTRRRNYAQVVSFTEKDPLEEELREYVPRPPLPEVNRARGRISFEYGAIKEWTSRQTSHQEGLVLRADMTRIGGSYWNFTGYWRGRINSRGRGAGQTTLTDLVNRTYQIGLFYNNPRSKYVAGFGRLLLPWATSQSAIDGGYFARRLSRTLTAGLFAGSTPDPTAWNYNPNRQLAGAFVNYEAGSFEALRFTSTEGVALTQVHWKPERRYLFAENGLFWRNSVSLYHNLEMDVLKEGRFGASSSGPVLSRSFLTFRLQPVRRLTFDFNHNYFRGAPTFDSSLIGTGLVDRLLFQGLSAGVRGEILYRIALYAQLGRNSRESDDRASWNHLIGASFGKIPWTGLRADARYARFNSSFGSGSYSSITFLKELADDLRLEAQIGQQDLASQFTRQSRSRFAGATVDWSIGRHYILGGGVMFYRGQLQNYDQIFFNLGYRF